MDYEQLSQNLEQGAMSQAVDRITQLEADNRALREQAACGHHSYRGDALPCGDCGWTKPTPAPEEGSET